MSRIQFERKKHKKGYIIPLAIILLLYFTIPVFLINKGSGLIDNSLTKMKKGDSYGPTVEYYNGISFLSTAASFPGFARWSENIVESSVNQMLDEQNSQFNRLCTKLINEEIDPDNVKIIFDKGQTPIILNVKTGKTDSLARSIELNDSLQRYIDSAFCAPWIKFVDRNKLDKSKIHLFCN